MSLNIISNKIKIKESDGWNFFFNLNDTEYVRLGPRPDKGDYRVIIKYKSEHSVENIYITKEEYKKLLKLLNNEPE